MPKVSKRIVGNLLRERRKKSIGNMLNAKREITKIADRDLGIIDLRGKVESKLWIKNKAFIGRVRSDLKIRSGDELNFWFYENKYFFEVTGAAWDKGAYFRVTDPNYIEALKVEHEKLKKMKSTH